MMERYSHTQVGYYLIVIYSLAIMIAAYLLRPFSRNLLSQVGLITLLLALATFATMKVIVDDKKIQIRLGFGAIRKSFSFSEIETYQIVKNPWYYLWASVTHHAAGFMPSRAMLLLSCG